jgi:2-amino-4-hydroxy-6-hydroxymethyldihydropteridine diphosphokinase
VNEAVVGTGSNIEPERHIALARDALAKDHVLLCESRFVRTAPIGVTDQPEFTNGVFLIATTMTRESLKAYLKRTEDRLGRIRTGNRYGPRTIDLDIVVWNGEIVDQDYYDRDFLRHAVAEVLPALS